MARLDGEKPAIWPWIIGLLVLVAIGVGGYFLYQNQGAETVDNSDVSAVHNRPGNMSNDSDKAAPPADKTTDDNAASTDTSLTTDNDNSVSNGDGTNNSNNASKSAPASGSNAQSGAMNSDKADSEKNELGTKRSKTITNDKTNNTVTYSKEVHGDGSATNSKQTGKAPAAP